MTVTEKIINYIKILPESTQEKILDYAEYLGSKEDITYKERLDWSDMSLYQAMRGMESEPEIYKIDDIKESINVK